MPKSPHLSSRDIQPVLLTFLETARFLNVGRTTIYGLVSKGDLEAVKIGASSRIKRNSAENLVKRLPAARVNLSPRESRQTAKK